jgi:ATP-dependent protease Clp ATPase subunit
MKKIILLSLFIALNNCSYKDYIVNPSAHAVTRQDIIKIEQELSSNINLSFAELEKKDPDAAWKILLAGYGATKTFQAGVFLDQREDKLLGVPEDILRRIAKECWDIKKDKVTLTCEACMSMRELSSIIDKFKKLGYGIAGILGIYILGKTFISPVVSPWFDKWYKKYLFKNDIKPEQSTVAYGNIIGFDNIKKELEEIFENINKQKKTKKLEKNNHILFYGAPGNGKTFVAQGFANKLNIPYFYISAAKLFENKDSIQLSFEKLSLYAKKHKTPILVFIDEIDLIVPSRKQKSISAEEKQQLQNFLSILDGKNSMEGVLLIVNTNYKDDLDDALLRDGRIGIHIEFTNPNKEEKKELLIHFTKEFEIILPDEFDYNYFCEQTENFSIAKIRTLIKNMAGKVKKINKNKVLDNQTLYSILNK